MSEYIRTDMKIKQADGTFKKYSPTVTLGSVLMPDNKTLDEIISITDEGVKLSGTATKAEAVEWSSVNNTPDTLEGYGITDGAKASELNDHINDKNNPHGVTKDQINLGNVDNTSDKDKPISDATQAALNNKLDSSEVTTTAEANKILRLDENAQIPASILPDKIPIEKLPAGALERCVVVSDDETRFTLTNDEINGVQLGDTVKVNDTGMMYLVVDVDNLNNEAGYEPYNAGSATSVPWSGVLNSPTTLNGYGITDAVNSADVVTTAEPNKLLKLDDAGKFPMDVIPQHIEFVTYTEADI